MVQKNSSAVNNELTLNAYKVYQMHTGNMKMTYLDFLHDSITLMISVNSNVPLPIANTDDTPERCLKDISLHF